jgi:hypothetical protein
MFHRVGGMATLLTRTLLLDRNPGRMRGAGIRISLAVATAHRVVVRGAGLRTGRAGARLANGAALGLWWVFAEEAGRAAAVAGCATLCAHRSGSG